MMPSVYACVYACAVFGRASSFNGDVSSSNVERVADYLANGTHSGSPGGRALQTLSRSVVDDESFHQILAECAPWAANFDCPAPQEISACGVSPVASMAGTDSNPGLFPRTESDADLSTCNNRHVTRMDNVLATLNYDCSTIGQQIMVRPASAPPIRCTANQVHRQNKIVEDVTGRHAYGTLTGHSNLLLHDLLGLGFTNTVLKMLCVEGHYDASLVRPVCHKDVYADIQKTTPAFKCQPRARRH